MIRLETETDFWAKTGSSLVYAFASRVMLGIGDRSPNLPGMGLDKINFSGMGLADLLRRLFDTMLKTCGPNSVPYS